jgi:SAM-dependent methyltransferase
VAPQNYAAAFGEQWKAFRKTQLDSYTGTNITRIRLERCLGGSFDVIVGKKVLEAGCGAGRFTEILLAEGGKVFACDLSVAVESNRENCGGSKDYFVCQADVRRLPVALGSFDVVICLGVIQHTPNPNETIAALCAHVAPGGLLVIDHYAYGAEDMTAVRQMLRRFLIRRSPGTSLTFVRSMVAALWPMHRLTWICRHLPLGNFARRCWLGLSPVLDYHESYSQLSPKLLYAWAALDTHDALTDRFKHKRTPQEIADILSECGMVDVIAHCGGNGVEARARKPSAT